jgi:hypothetical protein
MKTFCKLCLLLALFAGPLSAQQNNPVSSVTVRVSAEQDMVTILYNLAHNTRIPFYHIEVAISLDGRPLDNPAGLSGDIGQQVTAGLGKKIVWDAFQDVSSLEGELKVEVRSLTTPDALRPCTPIKTLPVYAGLGGAATAGLGLLISGVGVKSSSNDLYDTYSANLDPNDPVYNELSRDAHYDEANSQHKKGSWLMIAGGTALAAGGAIMVSRLLKINRYNRRCQQGTVERATAPRWQLEPVTAAGPGIALIHRF